MSITYSLRDYTVSILEFLNESHVDTPTKHTHTHTQRMEPFSDNITEDWVVPVTSLCVDGF